jgi:tRNA modification GTPase
MTKLNTLTLTARHAYVTPIYDVVSHETLDHAVVLYFKAPCSFTGEDSVEIQCHGSKAVLSSILKNLSLLDDYRLAEPGEFSKRAFYHQKMDLTEAEGLADLIDAETVEQQRYAVKQMDGGLKNLYDGWRNELLQVYSWLEAYIDFPEENIPENVKTQHMNTVFKLIESMQKHLESPHYGERLREGFRVVIAGPANAGKSSLMNALIKRDAVIVSDIAGTTRDAVDINFDLGGYPVIFTDTAGLRNHTTDVIEKKGVDIAFEKIRQADIVLGLFDASKDDPSVFENIKNICKNNLITVANKSDLLTFEQCSKLEKQGCLLISVQKKTGLEILLKEIENLIRGAFTDSSSLLITRQRYREAVAECVENLKNFNFEKEIELAAEDIRLAARALGKITGRFEVEEILDKIFGSFCIGK